MTNTEKIQKFIADNNIEIEDGNRNAPCTVLCGYALHIGIENATDLINNVGDFTEDTQDEFKRVFPFAKSRNYGEFWKTEEAKKQYIFSTSL